MKEICEKISKQINLLIDSLAFIYKNEEIDFNKKFEDIATIYDQKFQG